MTIKDDTAKLISKYYDIDESTTFAMFDQGILSEHTCKKVLVREAFLNRPSNMSKTESRVALADKFCVSYDTIVNYVRGM